MPVENYMNNREDTYGSPYTMRGHSLPGPFKQKIWERGGVKKQLLDPAGAFTKETLLPLGALAGGMATTVGFMGKTMDSVFPTLPRWGFGEDVLSNVRGSAVGKFSKGLGGKLKPFILPAIAIGAGALVARHAAKPILNWINRGVRNVITTGERKGTEEFKSQYGLTESGSIDPGFSGGAGKGELSKKTRKEKGIKIDFK